MALQDRRIQNDARRAGVSARSLQIQAMLHLPAPYVPSWRSAAEAYEAVQPVAVSRASRINDARREMLSQADLVGVRPDMKIEDHSILTADGRRIPVEVRRVLPSMGHRFQSRIHYLLSPRADTCFQVGLFQVDAALPMLYLGFSMCDREDLLNTASLGLTHRDDAIVLTRAVGVPDLPENAFSYTLRRALGMWRARGARPACLMTAINPYLGFTGASVRAAGLLPASARKVSYNYDAEGQFVTRRLSPGDAQRSRRRLPPNLILVRAFKRAQLINKLYDIKHEVKPLPLTPGERHIQVKKNFLDFESWLPVAREALEAGWSPKTLHPDFVGSNRTSAASGQCGVSSVWLLREAKQRFHMDLTYCYGDLEFEDPQIGSVRRHCWLEVPASGKDEGLVIDITVDQAAGFGAPILVGEPESLHARGIHYRARIKKTIEQLPLDSVWNRYLILADSIHAADIAA